MRPVYVASGGVSEVTEARPDNTFQAVIKEAHDASLDWIGMGVKPRYPRSSKLKPTDVNSIPA